MRIAVASARAATAIAAAMLALAAGVVPSSAEAASYTVWSCRGPDGAPLATDPWVPLFAGAGTRDTCATGGSLSARIGYPGKARDASGGDGFAPPEAPYEISGYGFALPEGARVAGYRIHVYATTAESRPDPRAEPARPWVEVPLQAGVDSDGGKALEVDAGCLTSGCVFGDAGDPLAGSNLLAASGLASPSVAILARCAWAWGCQPQASESTVAEVRLFRSQVDIADDEAPLLGPSSGSLASGAPLTAEATLEATATDRGGGVARVQLLIDGTAVAHVGAAGSCAEPYVRPAPCPEELSAGFTVSATSLAAGAHTAALRAIDAAGNATTGPPIEFSVGGATPPAAAATLGAGPAQVPPARVEIDVTRRRVVLSGKGAQIAGVVKDQAGRAVPGARVRISSRPFGVRRTKLRLESVLTAGADGRFSATMRGRSRLLLLDVDDAAHRAVEPAEIELMQRLRVRVFVSRKGIRNGSTMSLRARVEGAGAGVAGKALVVMTTVRGRWTPIGSVRTDRRGEAVWRYRFGGTVIHALYRFRVRVEHAGDIWPWRTADSRTVIVEVSP
jgi:hypothetical protein